jgi:7-cyano-7-deazaguanine synthase
MSEESNGAVVLLSGGVDSTVLAHHVVRDLGRAPVHALSFNYGQRHAKELEYARAQVAAAGVAAHRVIDITFLGPLLRGGSALIEGGEPVPDLRDVDPDLLDQPPTYVPNRNMILLAMAAAYAEAHGLRDVFYAAQAQDEYGYWDCTAAFLDRINRLLALNRKEPVTIHAPFVHMSKAETVKLGITLGVDFARTWSCYRGGEAACGTCPTCVERLNAFRAAGVEDPLRYEHR